MDRGSCLFRYFLGLFISILFICFSGCFNLTVALFFLILSTTILIILEFLYHYYGEIKFNVRLLNAYAFGFTIPFIIMAIIKGQLGIFIFNCISTIFNFIYAELGVEKNDL